MGAASLGDAIMASLCGFSLIHHFLAGFGMHVYKKKATAAAVQPQIQLVEIFYIHF